MIQEREGKVKKENIENNSKIVCTDKKFNVDVGTLLQVCCSAVESLCTIIVVDLNLVLRGPAKIINITLGLNTSSTKEYSSECPDSTFKFVISPDGKEASISYNDISVENGIEPTQAPCQNCIIGCEMETEEWKDKLTLDIRVNGFSFLTQGRCESGITCDNQKIIELIELLSNPFEANITIDTKLVETDHPCCLLKRKKKDLGDECTKTENEFESTMNRHIEKIKQQFIEP